VPASDLLIAAIQRQPDIVCHLADEPGYYELSSMRPQAQ